MAGRLFLNVRDEKALAYSVGSFSRAQYDPGFFALYVLTTPDKVAPALEEMKAELERLKTEPVPEEELAQARNSLIGSHVSDLH